MCHYRARNVQQLHRAIQIVRVYFAGHPLDLDIAIVEAAQLQRSVERHLEDQVHGAVYSIHSDVDLVVLLVNAEAAAPAVQAVHAFSLAVGLGFACALVAGARLHLLAVITGHRDAAVHQGGVYHCRPRRVGERNIDPVGCFLRDAGQARAHENRTYIDWYSHDYCP